MDPERETPDQSEDGDDRTGLDRHLGVFLEDSALWPVLLAAVLILVTCGSALLLLAFVERNLFAAAAALILLWMSVDFAVRRRRRGGGGPAIWILAGLWALSAAAAAIVASLDLF